MFGVCVRVGQLPLPPAALWRCCCKPAVLQCFCAGLVNAILPGEKWVSRLFDGLIYIYISRCRYLLQFAVMDVFAWLDYLNKEVEAFRVSH